MDPMGVDSSAVLVDLAREYERSCLVLMQIEDHLKERLTSPSSNGVIELEPLVAEDTLDAPAVTPDNGESMAGNADFPARAKSATMRMLGNFRRKVQQPPKRASFGSNDAFEATRRISVVNMSAAALPKGSLPRRAASFYSPTSTVLQPTMALNRRAPINSTRQQEQEQLQQQQQQQQVTAPDATTSPAAISKSASSTHGPVATIMLRLTSEQLVRPRQHGPESPKSPLQAALPDIPTLPPRNVHSQPLQPLQLHGSSRLQLELQDNFVGDGLIDIRGDMSSQQQLPQPYVDEGTRRRSMSRRGSDYIFSPLGAAATSTGPQQHQQQLRQQLQQLQLHPPGSPAPLAAASRSGCSSPATGASSGLPTIPAAYGGGFYFSRPLRRSSSNNPVGLISSSRNHMQPSWVADELEMSPSSSVGDNAGGSATQAAPLIFTERAFPEEDGEEDEIATPGATVDVGLSSSRVLRAVLDADLAATGPVPASIPMGASFSRPAGATLPRLRLSSPVGRARSFSNAMMLTNPPGIGSPLRTVSSTLRKLGSDVSQLGA
ncbi:hypothetical protein Vretimale_15554 [Volvox reticuliferus]|uniref:Uncharacterized protein n=1 Tax=Volvox reticuliferus TaxID=1737510 RepID=A0A8J4CR40_9CHLO|nr:hypothetical protein Vretifemale_15078 [Volvox reticuliferus]GIM12134.1 hypothetical protein Vretimale_15554 [Volvox reticuliferus]